MPDFTSTHFSSDISFSLVTSAISSAVQKCATAARWQGRMLAGCGEVSIMWQRKAIGPVDVEGGNINPFS